MQIKPILKAKKYTRQLFKEIILEKIGDHVLRSDCRPATCWLYDIRTCGICGEGLGTV